MSTLETAQYSPAEELANSLTHGLAALLSIAGLVVMVVYASINGNAWHIVSSSIYGASLIVLFTASTFYHAISQPFFKYWLRKIDHASIYLLIAGSYTPFLLVSLRGPWGWTLFGVIWSVAAIGILLEFIDSQRFRKLSIVLYLGLGWLVVIAIKPMLDNVPTGGLLLLLLGGLFYSFGVIFYLKKKMLFHHAVWHLFVMAGSVLHFFSVLFYVIP